MNNGTNKPKFSMPSDPEPWVTTTHYGPTLRQYYAAKALAGLLSRHGCYTPNAGGVSPKEAASWSLYYADAMIAAEKESAK